MDAIPHEHEYDAEVARLCSRTGYRCPKCRYELRDLETPRCPECGRAVKLREIGEYGTTEETRTALRLHGPVACRACGERVHDREDACCPGCRTRVALSWFPQYRRAKGLDRAMHWAVTAGGAGMVANVLPAAMLLIRGQGLFIVPAVGAAAAWFVWVVRIRRGLAARRPGLVGATPWAVMGGMFGVALFAG